MKRALTMLAAAIALPLLAEEPAKTTAAKTADAKPKAAATSTAAPAPQQPESPLVAAARRANRLGKKPANVITNDNLVKAGSSGHVTTTLSYPWATSHRFDSPEVKTRQGITEGLIRLSVGVEPVERIRAEMARGLAAAAVR